jgi:hypothetical protein
MTSRDAGHREKVKSIACLNRGFASAAHTAACCGELRLEYAAVSYYFTKKINQLQIQGPVFAMSQLQALENLCLQYMHGSRFNCADLFGGNREGLTTKFTPARRCLLSGTL